MEQNAYERGRSEGTQNLLFRAVHTYELVHRSLWFVCPDGYVPWVDALTARMYSSMT